MKAGILTRLVLAVVGTGFFVLSGCSSKLPVNLNVHTEPEGAHIIYRVDNSSWTYLGVTPLDVVMGDKKIKDDHIFTIKAMRCGYLEQAKEWTGDELINENEEKGVIFWTPRLIKDTQ